jgi:3-oxoacyl-[acyl-carrier-protein] synthase I
MRRPVFIAGRGVVSGFGSGLNRLITGIFEGKTALQARSRTAGIHAPTECVAEFPATTFDSACAPNDLPRQSSLLAIHEALEEAGQPDRQQMGIILATTKADMSGICGEGAGLASPMYLADQLSTELQFGIEPAALSCACASGVMGIASAARRIASGEADQVTVISMDLINEFILRGFGGMGALDPERCRPFDKERRGLSLGDGAAAVVLSCDERDSIGIRVTGYAGANDACHVTGPDYEGKGVGLAATRAVAHAGLQMEDIDLLHLHATGTHANDKSEAIGLGNAWSHVADQTPPAFGTKSQTGHTLGAAGVMESLMAIAALQRGSVPQNIGLTSSDCDERLQLTRSPLRLGRANHALKVASGFGGVQGAAVFSV